MLPVVRRNVPAMWQEPFASLRRDLGRIFEGWPEDQNLGAYPVDVSEDDNKIYVDAELPGFRKEDIDVTLENGALMITAERKPEEFEGTRHLQERRYTKVQRSFALPGTVDESHVDAKFEDGVLHMEMQKTGDSKGHRITVH